MVILIIAGCSCNILQAIHVREQISWFTRLTLYLQNELEINVNYANLRAVLGNNLENNGSFLCSEETETQSRVVLSCPFNPTINYQNYLKTIIEYFTHLLHVIE